jgi:hypothetical protein
MQLSILASRLQHMITDAGAVRKTSSRVIPDVNGGNGQFTAGRPPALPEKEEKPNPQARLDRWRSRRKR